MRLIEQQFDTTELSLATGLDAGVPHRLWDAALLAPARTFFAIASQELCARQLALGWELGGGRGAPPPELAAIVEAIHGGTSIVDDIEDGSTHRRGRPALHVVHGLPLALNAGHWLELWSFRLVEQLGLAPGLELDVTRRISATLLRRHYGQALDLSVRVTELAQEEVAGTVAAITDLKAGALVELATTLGAVVAGADFTRVAALGAYGAALGRSMQMLDDLAVLFEKKHPDRRDQQLRGDRPSWTWAWLADELTDERYGQLRRRAREVVVGAPTEPLAAGMRLALRSGAQARVRQVAHAALRELQAALGPHERLASLRDELEYLPGSSLG